MLFRSYGPIIHRHSLAGFVFSNRAPPPLIDVPAFIDFRKIGRFQILVAALCAMVVQLDGLNTQVIGYLGPVLSKA
jgi:MFS transporter, AAHS family, 4-hydroxybenzoate transporter